MSIETFKEDSKKTASGQELNEAARGRQKTHWEGIFSHFREVPRLGQGFEGSYWVQRSRSRTNTMIAAAADPSVPSWPVQGQALLPLLVSIAGSGRQKLRILDFGGGMGVSYFQVIQAIPTPDFFDYTIVETGPVCEAARDLFPGDSKIHFVSKLPDPDVRFDIVHLNSSLQYIEDYAELIKQLIAYDPCYVLFVRLSAGANPTYATAQMNVQGSQIPYWFISLAEIVSLMSSLGYALVFKSASDDEFNQENFPASHRVGQPCNVLFTRFRENQIGPEGTESWK